MSMTPTRRRFLQTAAGAAALSVTTSAHNFGNTRILQVAATVPAPPGQPRGLMATWRWDRSAALGPAEWPPWSGSSMKAEAPASMPL